MTYGDACPTANPQPELEVTEVGSSNSVQTPRRKSDIVMDSLMAYNLAKQSPGLLKSIPMREVPPDGPIAGGWHSVDENERAQTMQGCLVVAGLGLMLSLCILCWVAIFRLLYLL